MEHKTRAKALSWLLTLAMLVGMLPAMTMSAKAVEPVARVSWMEVKSLTNPVPQQKQQSYASLPEAVTKLSENTGYSFMSPSLTLLADVEISDTINMTWSGERTLNLEGHSITMTDSGKDVIALTGSNTTLKISYDGKTSPTRYYKFDGTTRRAVIQNSSEGADGSFTGSCITGGNRGIYVQAGTLDLSRTTIIGNNVGVYVEGTAEIKAPTITGNNIGVYAAGTTNVQGGPIIKDNHFDGTTDRNVYLASGKYLTASDNLLEGANIGVTMADGTGVFTNTASDKTDRNNASYFFSDNSSYEVTKNAEGQLELTALAPTTYSITTPVSVAHGTLDAPAEAEASAAVTVTATPEAGYQLGNLGVYQKKSDNQGVTIRALSGYQTNGNEGWAKLTDGNKKTKWAHVFNNSTDAYVIVKATEPFVLKSYTLTTANDTAKYSGRNWKNWTIYGANFASDGEATKNSPEWKPVVTVANNTTLQAKNYTPYTFNAANVTVPYQYYKIKPTATRGLTFIQMAELTMTGDVYEKLALTQDSTDTDKYTFTMPDKDVYADGSFMIPVASVTNANGATTLSSTLSGALTDWNAAGNDATLKLLSDVTTGGTIGVSGTKILDLNGHGIRMTGNNISVISVGKGANLTLNDSSPSTTHYITLNNWRGTKVEDAAQETEITNGAGVLKVTGGYITGHYGGNNGGVNVNGGTLIMNAGTICGNRAAVNGGGVMLENNAASRFTMNGGTICYNWADYGAGVYIWTNAVFTMTGGTISHNHGNQHGGGVLEHGKLVMSGGGITENTGGGVARWASGTQPIELSGDAQIISNTKNGAPYNIRLFGAGTRRITVTDNLGENAKIGLVLDTNTGVFTNSSVTTNNDANKFSSDNAGYLVRKNNDGQLFLGVAVNVTFDMQGHGTQVTPVETVSGATINAPDAPTASGWEFGGWYRDTAFQNPWSFDRAVTQNTILYAKWTQIKATVTAVPTAKKLTTNDEAQALVEAGTADAHGAMRYALGDNATIVPGAWSETIPTGKASGTYDFSTYYVWYKAAGQDGFGDSEPACVPVTIAKAVAGVTAPVPQTPTYNGAAQTLIAAGSTTQGTMQYALGENGVLAPTTSWSADLPQGRDAGTYYVWYKAAGDLSHEDSDAAYVTVTVAKATPSASAPAAQTPTYDGTAQALVTAGTTSGGVMRYALGENNTAAPEKGWKFTVPTATDAGTYHVWYKVTGDNNYNGTDAQCVPAAIGKAPNTVTPAAPTAKEHLTYSGQPQQLINPSVGSGTILYSLGTDSAATGDWSATLPVGTDAGTYHVWYKTAGDENHFDSNSAHMTASIGKATPTISAADLSVMVENSVMINPILSVEADSWQFSSENETVATVDTAVGEVDGKTQSQTTKVTITATPVDTANYNNATAEITVTVTPKNTQALTFDESDENATVENGVVNKAFGDAAFTVTAEHILSDESSTGYGAIRYASSNTDVATVNAETGEVTIHKAGTATVTATAAETQTFAPATAFYLLNVKKAVPEVTAPAPVDQLNYDNTAKALITAGTSTVGTTMEYALGDHPTDWSTELPNASDVGTYVVWYRVVGNENYTDVDASSILATIAPASINTQGITVIIPDQNTTGSQLTPKPVVKHRATLLTEGTDYTLSYGTNTEVGTGTVTLTGIGKYTEQREASFNILLSAFDDTLTFAAPGPYTYGGVLGSVPAVKAAKGTSLTGETVEVYYASSPSGDGKLWDSNAKLNAGTYYVWAELAETASHAAAASARIPFDVVKATPDAPTGVLAESYENTYQVTLTIPNGKTYADYEYSTDGTAWKSVPALKDGKFTPAGLTSGQSLTVYLRTKADSNHNPSPVVTAVLTTPTKYLLSYDANGSAAAVPASAAYESTDTVTAAEAISRVGYSFNSWNTAADGTGNSYAAGDEFSLSDHTSLYAQWDIISYSVTYVENGGSDCTDVTGQAYDAEITLPTPTRDDHTFSGWAASDGGVPVYYGGQKVSRLTAKGDETVTLYAVWTANETKANGSMTETIAGQSSQIADVSVRLMRGNVPFGEAQTTDENGNYVFQGVPAGTYNLVATRTVNGEEQTVTTLVEVKNDETVKEVSLPASQTNSVLEVTGEGTPAIMVGGLEDLASDNAETSKEVTITMTVQKQDENTARDEIAEVKEAVAADSATGTGKTELEFLSISVKKETVDEAANVITEEELTETSRVMELIIPFQTEGRYGFTVYRHHDGRVEKLEPAANSTNHQDGTFAVDADAGLVYIYASRFSSYAIGFEEGTSYTATVNNGTGDGDYIEGATVTIAADAAPSGKVFDKWTSEDGVLFADESSASTTFTMPAKAVTVTATYKDAPIVETPSGSGSTAYAITVNAPQNGTVSADRKSAVSGAKVTVTVTPDAGYETNSVTVTDARGRAVAVTKNADGTYTYTQPAGAVTVDVTFHASADVLAAFIDVDASAWYADAVRWAVENGAMNGVGNNRFSPNGDTTRAMVVTMLWRMEGSPAYVGMSEFTDVDNEQWYGQAVRWASAENIVTGYENPDGAGMIFNPNGAVTREQLATILYRYAQYKKADVSASASIGSYGDAQAVSGWAASAMQWACGSGIIKGMDGNLAPVNHATRAQVAMMLMRYSTAK